MLRVDEVSVSFGDVGVLDRLELDVGEGERLAVLGPSGSGKSTLLRTIAGLVRPAVGRVLLDGEDVTDVPPHRRGIGLMHQEGALFPHHDVAGNVAFGLRVAGMPRAERERRTRELLDLVGLPGFEARSIGALSGGERQRVGLARALAPRPRLLLLDEPLGSLDRPLRERLVEELGELFERLRLSVVHVTHDVVEAFAIGNRVALMRAGRIVQQGPPDELWTCPASQWSAAFLGLTNLREVGDRRVVIRPEAVRLFPGDEGVVLSTQRRGPAVSLRVQLDTGEVLESVTTELQRPEPGQRVRVEIEPAGIVDLSPR